MEIVMILVPVTLILVALGIFLFSWAVKNGQYDDLEGPAHRILYDDDKDMIPGDAQSQSPTPKGNGTHESQVEQDNEDAANR